MRTDGLVKHLLVVFVLALGVYALLYGTIEHRRTRKGPWNVTFTRSDDAPALLINQPRLALTNVQIRFLGSPAPTNAASTLVFSQPKPVPFEIPFGECVFMDATFLPGTLTFRLFGHEIELLPRVLIIDHEEHPWVSGSTITLPPAGAAQEERKR
jgi:hypothetical protein